MNLAALIRLEFLKLKANYNYALLFILLLFSFLIVTALFYMTISVNGQEGGALLPLEGQFNSIYNRLGQIGSIIIALLAILNIGTEYKNLSFKRNIMDGLTRNQLFLSKIIGLLLLISAAVIAMLIIIVVVGVGMLGNNMTDIFANLFSVNLLRLIVRLIFAAGFALFFTILIKSSSFAIITLIGYIAFEMIIGLIERFKFQTEYAGYLPHNYVTDTVALPELSALQLTLVAIYILSFFAASWLIFKRRDL